MPYPFLGVTGRSYVQYTDEATGRMLITEPGGTYTMQPVPGAGNVPVPPGDGLWGDEETGPEDTPAPGPEAVASAPPGAPDQPALKAGRTTTPAADAAPQEG